MDGYLVGSFEDLVVPKYQESSDTFAAPDIWGGWPMSSPHGPEKCFLMDQYNHGFRASLYCQIETGSIEDSKRLSLEGVKNDHRQLQDFNGIEQMDDTFLSSILEDVPGNWSHHSSSELCLKQSDNVDVQCLSSSNNSLDSSMNVSIGPSAILSDGRDVPTFPFVRSNSGACHGLPMETVNSDLSKVNRSNEYSGVESSLEEVVLLDLQRATEKLTDETRKCFRDTFYRLAKNSLQAQVSDGTNPGDRSIRAPRSHGCPHGDRTRSRRDCGTESETNSMDRAVANLTFNKMDYNIELFPLAERGSELRASQGGSKRRTRSHPMPRRPLSGTSRR